MLKSIFKYAVLAGLFKKYRSKLYLLLSLVLVYFLIGHIYTDVQQYLSDVHPEYLIFALWVKSISLVVLCVALLWAFKPRSGNNHSNNNVEKVDISDADRKIMKKVSSKPDLVVNEESSENYSPDTNLSDGDIIAKIRNKRNLETRADKIINELEKK